MDDKSKAEKTQKPPFVPQSALKDELNVPDKTILYIPDHEAFSNPTHFESTGQSAQLGLAASFTCACPWFMGKPTWIYSSALSLMPRFAGTEKTTLMV